jgi:Kef-type K+ transport system membrane component KefB
VALRSPPWSADETGRIAVLSEWPLAAGGLVLVVVVARIGGALAARVGQPQIAGQLVAVVFIGPTMLGGQIAGVVEGAAATGAVGGLFPPVSVDLLTVVGSLGLILYMLLVGLTIDPRPMVRRGGTIALLTLAVSAATAAVAVVAAGWMGGDGGWKGTAAAGAGFALALSAALIATGVPVVARILEERGLLRTELGALIIASGASVTTLALSLSGVAVTGGDAGAAGRFVLILAAGTALVGIAAALGRSHGRRLVPGAAVTLLVGLAVAAGVAGESLLGTALLGPLLVGVLARGDGRSASSVEACLGGLVRGLLLPVFLGVAALHTNLRELGPAVLAPVAAILAAVIAVKLAAGYGAARATGFSRGDAGAVAASLQCGGTMTIAISLAVLNADLITTRTHAALMLSGLVTTVLTGPLLHRGRPAPHVD